MSIASKIFLGTSVVGAAGVVYGVHYLQKREQETMYQGVIKDDIRVRNKATAAAAARLQTASESATIIPSIALQNQSSGAPPLNTPGAPVQRSYDQASSFSSSPSPSSSSRSSSSFSTPPSSASGWTYPSAAASPRSSSTSSPPPPTSASPVRRFDEDDDRPLMGVGVAQPPPLIDDDCVTCVISPPPQLAEAQSKEQRQRDREERLAEYEAQKKLAGKLEQEQGVHEPQGRMV